MNALPSAFLPPSGATHSQLGLNSAAAESIPGPSGATAQTGGFAQAGTGSTPAASSSLSSSPPKAGTFSSLTNQLNSFGFAPGPDPASAGNAVPSGFVPPSEALGSGFGGGLASSPNVPRPGASIDPATGKPHTAGLTRAELEARRVAAQGPLDTAPSSLDGRRLSEMSGKEQAARQLTSGLDGASDGGLITPGKELPGGWGPTKQVPVPGSSPNAPSSVYQDITQGLEKVGKGAFGLIPQGLKDALNTEAPLDKGKQPMGSPPKARRSSVGVFLENAKQQAGQIIHDVQDALKDEGRRPSTTTGPVGAAGAGADGGVFQQVKQFLAEAGQAAGNPSRVTSVVGSGHAGPAAPRTSLPSGEVTGARPGEHSTGVGALPGPATETGVAVLPDEKTSTSGAPTQNQGLMPGEVPVAAAGSSKPEELAAVPAASDRAPPVEASTTSGKVLDNIAPAAGLGAALGLAAPLPATHLGDGAAHGATDLEAAGVTKSASFGSTTSAAPSTTASTLDSTAGSASAPATRHANERTDSNASVTAIRGGHEGHKPSPLAASTIAEKPTVGEGNGVSGAKSLTPGAEVDGVGHPSTRGADTTREVGSYPKPDHDGPITGERADKDGHSTATAVATGTGVAGATGAAAALAHHDKDNTVGKAAGTTPSANGTTSNAAHSPSATSNGVTGSSGLENLQPAPGHSKADVVAGTKALNATSLDTSSSLKAAGTGGSVDPPRADTTGLENLQPAKGESKADVVGQKALDSHHINTPTSPTKATTTTPATTATSATTPASPVIKTSAGAAAAGTTGAGVTGEKGHQRTGSNASTGSNGKKKVGFMSKLKGEIKVIGGKIAHDEKKVQEGERLKHGE